jgi:eukaryotic-like serine/threonine-protein kinase
MADRTELADESGPAPAVASWDAPPPGTIVGGSYRVLETVGAGGMGLVLRAQDEKLEREVALKMVHSTRGQSWREWFLREARAMARVDHRNVVKIHAFGEHVGVPYFVMEYVPGVDLETLVDDGQGPLAIDEALGILDQVCAGVTAIHDAGAIHRDLKLSNVLLGPAFRVVVCDFGVAQRLDDVVGGPQWVAGTPGYIAPECLSGRRPTEDVARRSDVYSLGVLAYELLVGLPPFDSESAAALNHAHCTRPPPLPSDLRPELPPEFDKVLLHALAKDPSQRTPSAADLRVELAAARQRVSCPYGQTRVLVVDDDDISRSYLADVLRLALPDAEVTSASDGDYALTAATARPPSLAIVDLKLPGMNGVELVAALRADRRTKETAVLVVSGYGDVRDWYLLQRLGARGYIPKPIDPVALTSMARSLLSSGARAPVT